MNMTVNDNGRRRVVLYMANPTSNPAIREAMTAGVIGWIDSPRQRNIRPPGVTWCADNGCFGSEFNLAYWWKFVRKHTRDVDTCLFVTAPDVVGDAWKTYFASMPWLPRIRELGYPAAFVAQDGQENLPVPWHDFDVLFIGGTTDWKLGEGPRQLCAEAHRRGKHVHVGRVNSGKRYRYARDVLGARSADGTFLRFAPTENLGRMMRWFA